MSMSAAAVTAVCCPHHQTATSDLARRGIVRADWVGQPAPGLPPAGCGPRRRTPRRLSLSAIFGVSFSGNCCRDRYHGRGKAGDGPPESVLVASNCVLELLADKVSLLLVESDYAKRPVGVRSHELERRLDHCL